MTATDIAGPREIARPEDRRSTRPARQRAAPGLLDRAVTPRSAISPSEALAVSIFVWVAFIAGWGLLTWSGLVKPIFLPTPGAVAIRAGEMWADGSLVGHARASITVIAVGFALSSLLSIPVGLIAGTYPAFQALIGPLVGFTRYLPVTAFVPLFILWIGIGLEQQAAVIFFGVFFQQIVMVADLVRGVPNDLLNASYTLGTSPRRVLPSVILPAVAPGILDVLRVTIAWAWTYLVVAEMVGANEGLGYISIRAVRGFQVDTIFVAIAVIGLFGLFTDVALRVLRKRLFPWAD